MHTFLEWLDRYNLLIHFLATIPIVWTWWEVVFVRRRREAIWSRSAKRSPGSRPAVVVISLAKFDISKSVQAFLTTDESLKKALNDKRIFTVSNENEPLQASDMPEIAKRLDRLSKDVISSAADVVHVFCAAPMPVAILAGAVFGNRGDIRLYHLNQGAKPGGSSDITSVYEQWGRLNMHLDHTPVHQSLAK
ncbi:MAG: hypothetical protein H6508_08170 [Calditrichaeota bacterium]|nr:hypothetical protein [Calditrichota bacterium]